MMSLFRVDPNQSFNGPHQNRQAAEYGASLSQAKAATIMVHGRGATAQSMFPLADEFAQADFHYVAPQAQNHTWYPYSFLEPKEKKPTGFIQWFASNTRSSGIHCGGRHSQRKNYAAWIFPRGLSGG
jgi:alpha-beta hydrolase superfamily lysophospholipase